MILIGLGASHRTAPIALREHLSFSGEPLKKAYEHFRAQKRSNNTPITELVILATCNRTELYACIEGDGIRHAAPAATAAPLYQVLAEQCGLPPEELDGHLSRTVGIEAIRHLHRVAAGLESMVLGEPQILGQVSTAYQTALTEQAAGPVLSGIFRSAIRCGKRVRTETAIGRNPATISSVAVHLAEEALGSLRSQDVLVVGAGEMGSLATAALCAREPSHTTIISRTFQKASETAGHYCAQALPFDRLETALSRASVAVTATASPVPIIGPELVRRAISGRPDKPLVLVDISVPRNIDPAVKTIPGVRLFDVDDLQYHLNGSIAEREGEVPRAEAIVAQEMAAIQTWLHEQEVIPAITGLREKADSIRQQELDRALKRLPDLDEPTREQLRQFSVSLVKKLLHEPTRRLKAEVPDGHALEYAEALSYLFGLASESTHPHRENRP